MAACGQTSEHWLHWMQLALIQRGTCGAMPRFSSLAVAVGTLPSSGICDTGTLSPFRCISRSMTVRANSEASSGISCGTGAEARMSLAAAGTLTCSSASLVRSTASQFILTIASPFFS